MWLSRATCITRSSNLRRASRYNSNSTCANEQFMRWCRQSGILSPRARVGHVTLDGVAQRGLFATADVAEGEPLVAVPFSALFGRSTFPNRRVVTLTDRLYPRGAPPLRPLTQEEIIKESSPDMHTFAPSLQLASLLTLEYANPQSHLRPWFDVLPPPPVTLTGAGGGGASSSSTKPPPPIMNAANLDAESTMRILRDASDRGAIDLRGAELRAVSHELSERMGAFHEFLRQQMTSNFVLSTLIQRIAKARLGGDVSRAGQLFRWALALVDSRTNYGGNSMGVESDSAVLQLDPWRHVVASTVDDDEAIVARRERELAASPLPLTPSIAPLLDFVNHADGDLRSNVSLEAGGVPPLSDAERRSRLSMLHRLSNESAAATAKFDDGVAGVRAPPSLVFDKSTSDEELSRYLVLRATRPIRKDEPLLMWYQPQIEPCEDSFLAQFGFLPRPLSSARRDEQLRVLRGITEDRQEVEAYVQRALGGVDKRVPSKAVGAVTDIGDGGWRSGIVHADTVEADAVAHANASRGISGIGGDDSAEDVIEPQDAQIDRAIKSFEVLHQRREKQQAELERDLERIAKQDANSIDNSSQPQIKKQ